MRNCVLTRRGKVEIIVWRSGRHCGFGWVLARRVAGGNAVWRVWLVEFVVGGFSALLFLLVTVCIYSYGWSDGYLDVRTGNWRITTRRDDDDDDDGTICYACVGY
jgi:hypothetical protein